MNYIVTVMVSVFLGWSVFISLPFNELEQAFLDSDAEKIMSYGGEKTLITIDTKEGVYSKSQGKQVLKGFFNANPPKSFKFNFKGNDSSTTTFAIGSYLSEENYRISIKFKLGKEKHTIEAISIVKNEE